MPRPGSTLRISQNHAYCIKHVIHSECRCLLLGIAPTLRGCPLVLDILPLDYRLVLGDSPTIGEDGLGVRFFGGGGVITGAEWNSTLASRG